VAAAKHPDGFKQAAARARRERLDLVNRLERIADIRVWPGSANFSLIEVGDGPAVVAGLRARAFAVRPATFPGLSDRFIRITARGPQENERLVSALEDVLEFLG
jgi:histidinol-phosphate/aromatic aminotransferase/cobyric acid decarboxylase-like protein